MTAPDLEARLRAQLADAGDNPMSFGRDVAAAYLAQCEAMRELDALWAALEWYGNPDNWRDSPDWEGPEMTNEPLQSRVKLWMDACFGEEISNDRLERGDRLIEEVLELLQSGNYPKERVAALVDYVWSRPVGEPAQEVGGVMITLAAYCLAHDIDMHQAGETELARIWTKVEKIRAKQASKPTGSALPVAVQPGSSRRRMKRRRG